MIATKLLLAYFIQSVIITNPTIDISKVDLEQAHCLAENIYYESRNEDIRGQFAVANVTLNRSMDGNFPSTICDVVKASAKSKATNKLVCAFSWYCENNNKGKQISIRNKNGEIDQRIVDQFQVASMVAINVLSGQVNDNTNGSTHFHNPHVSSPSWRHQLIKTVQIGNHDFYKLR